MMNELRNSRTIIDSLFEANRDLTTVWIGIYNGSQYLSQMFSSLTSQSDSRFQILIVDNASTDSSWELLQGWVEEFKGRIRLVRNEMNIGATGSILLNRDLILSDWFMFMHQDDLYLSHHVKTLNSSISKSIANVVSISTSMGSLSIGGKRAPSPPRAQWLVRESDGPSQFLANIRMQIVPWPATALKTIEFNKIDIPWHSTAFPDTEITLRLSAYGKSLFIDKETMLYRENPLSESHSIHDTERELVSAASLARVLSSNEFSVVLSHVEKVDRDRFRENLQLSIQSRVLDLKLQNFLWLIANESIAVAWDYSDVGNLQDLRMIYSNIGSTQVSNLLDELSRRINPSFMNTVKLDSAKDSQPSDLLSFNSETKETSLDSTKLVWRIYSLTYRIVPFKVRKFMLGKFTVWSARRNPRHPWNFNW
jgi:glycosyltransferase involved in cell wall biosynthesis